MAECATYLSSSQLNSPPSYDSLYGRVKAAKQSSSGIVDFFKILLVILASTIGCTICVGLVLALPISMVVMGSIYIDDCPREQYIPIYLVVAGVLGITRNMSSMVQSCNKQRQGNVEENTKVKRFDSIMSFLILTWFGAGSVWVYRAYHDFSTDPSASDYCHPTLYDFAFWMITVGYIILGLVLVCSFCICIIALWLAYCIK